ncbi:hypothetical protein BGX38DRAFT_475697 [Terfezia claveryi]|nr:hypothetical protein BGX38DRAFT_475697 [Terfezia claveryi]
MMNVVIPALDRIITSRIPRRKAPAGNRGGVYIYLSPSLGSLSFSTIAKPPKQIDSEIDTYNMQRRGISNLTLGLQGGTKRPVPAEDNAYPTNPGNVNSASTAERRIQDPNASGQEPSHPQNHLVSQPREQPYPNLEQFPPQNLSTQSNSVSVDGAPESQGSPAIDRELTPRQIHDRTQGVVQVPTSRVPPASSTTEPPKATRQSMLTAVSQSRESTKTLDPASDVDRVIALPNDMDRSGREGELSDGDVFDGHCGPYLESELHPWPDMDKEEKEESSAEYVKATPPQAYRCCISNVSSQRTPADIILCDIRQTSSVQPHEAENKVSFPQRPWSEVADSQQPGPFSVQLGLVQNEDLRAYPFGTRPPGTVPYPFPRGGDHTPEAELRKE